ncbi:hypothetical protein C3415_19615, partial [Acinetobacter baumannii]|uniref:hypothetical protein n=1 Tax=Acinetobacter baumannii TaxID=470 RepID=UPI000CDEAB9C
IHADEYSEDELRVLCHHEACEIYRLRAELEKDKAQAVPECYVLVPKEPTEVMERAGFDKGAGFLANSIYKAMVEASESGAEG